MANTIKLTIGPSAQVFHDQTTGITICKGEVAELRMSQYHSKRIQNALQGGHLVLVPEANNVPKYTEHDKEVLNKKLHTQYEKGMTIEKMAKGYTLEQAKLLAELNEVEVEDSDTIETIFKAILEEE